MKPRGAHSTPVNGGGNGCGGGIGCGGGNGCDGLCGRAAPSNACFDNVSAPVARGMFTDGRYGLNRSMAPAAAATAEEDVLAAYVSCWSEADMRSMTPLITPMDGAADDEDEDGGGYTAEDDNVDFSPAVFPIGRGLGGGVAEPTQKWLVMRM